MKRYIVLFVIVVALAPFVMGVGAHRLMLAQREALAAQPMRVFWEAWELLDTSLYGDLASPQQRTYGAIRGTLELLGDPYTIFLEPQSGEVERDRLAGAYGGVGVDVSRDGDGNVLLFPYDDSPAQAAGVLPHDRLIAVDAISVAQLSLDEIAVLMRGEVGTQVTLTLARPPTPPFDLLVTLGEIRIPSVVYRILDQDAHIGYLQVKSFTSNTAEETSAAIEALLSAGATRLVLDLRDNGGGLVSPALETADLFLDGGVLLYEERRDEETTFSGHAGGIAVDVPVVVLVNRSTASAAEIVAGALQTRERAILIGTPTFGKGSVQLIFGLSDGSSLHVTSAVWLLPNRRRVEPHGLSPDIEVVWDQQQQLEDPQLARAIRYLQTGE
ncbi:MAG: peptidase S41 [Anaerolineae bacterium]|nr:peptidase S41 [Anaerolineae bacterium]